MPDPEVILCIDAGGTKTRTIIFDLLYGEQHDMQCGSCVPFMDYSAACDTVQEIFAKCAVLLGRDVRGGALGISMASAGLDTLEVRDAFQAYLGENCGRLDLKSDGEAALDGCLGGNSGAVICVGTGVVGLMRSTTNQIVSLDAWGWPAGDRGGGASIGRNAVERYLYALDAETADQDVLFREIGKLVGTSRPAAFSWLLTAARNNYASVVPCVLAAVENGSAEAAQLMHVAGQQISETAAIMRRRSFNVIHITGGLAPFIGRYLDSSFQVVADATLKGAIRGASAWSAKISQGNLL